MSPLRTLFWLSLALAGCRNESPKPAAPDAGSVRAQVVPARPLPPPPEPPQVPLTPEELKALPGHIAFVSEREKRPRIYLIRPDGSEERRLLGPKVDGFPVRALKDGSTLLAIVVEDPNEEFHNEQLWIQPLGKNGKGRAIGPKSRRVRNPSWQADGSWIYFESDINSFSDIYRIRSNGKELTRLTDNKEGNYEPTVSPDGRTVVFVSSRDLNAEIYRMTATGDNEQRISPLGMEDISPQFSPTSDHVAFISSRAMLDHVYVMKANGEDAQRVRPGPPPGPLVSGQREPYERDIAWSPDGKKLAFTARDATGSPRIWLADVETRSTRPLTSGRFQDDTPEWSPDGRFLAFVSNRTGDTELFVMRADGTGATQVTHSPGADWRPLWIPPLAKAQR